MKIAESSPLYEYWLSEQDENDEKQRLLKTNSEVPASILFMNEPYKWENLYQSIVSNLIKGDKTSIRGFIILLSTIKRKEKEKSLKALSELLDKSVITVLKDGKYEDIKSSRNPLIGLQILFNIFINPFELVIKKEKKHIYEKTGMFFYQLRKVVFLKN